MTPRKLIIKPASTRGLEIDAATVEDGTGVTYRVSIGPCDSTPGDFGVGPSNDGYGYTLDDADRWRNDHWRFVYFDVTPDIEDTDIHSRVYSYEYGEISEDTTITFRTIIDNNFVDQASECDTLLRGLRDRLNAYDLEEINHHEAD